MRSVDWQSSACVNLAVCEAINRPWKSMNDIDGGRGTGLQHAILLSTDSQVRFIPFNDNWSGREELRFVMWDGSVVIGIDSAGEEIVRNDHPGDAVDISQTRRGGNSPFSQLSAAYRVSGK